MSEEWSLNRGEWAEGYVFLKVLEGGKIYAGTYAGAKELTKNDENRYIDVLNVKKYINKSVLLFQRETDTEGTVIVRLIRDDNDTGEFRSVNDFKKYAETLLKILTKAKKGNITAPKIQKFFEDIGVITIKSPAVNMDVNEKYGGKTDIVLRVRCSVDQMEEDLGFSIKSHFGSNATLMNSGQGSTYMYKIENCTDQDMCRYNACKNVEAMLQAIKKDEKKIIPLGSKIITVDGEEIAVFDENLEHINTSLPAVISYMLLMIHGYHKKPQSKNLTDVVKAIQEENPLKLKNRYNPYETMFKNLLFAAFGGMTASLPWDGKIKVNGGFLDVSVDGDILYFRALSDDQFLSYLFNSTKIDSPSRGGRQKRIHQDALSNINTSNIFDIKTDHGDYGYVYDYEYQGETVKAFGINFQIRFNS